MLRAANAHPYAIELVKSSGTRGPAAAYPYLIYLPPRMNHTHNSKQVNQLLDEYLQTEIPPCLNVVQLRHILMVLDGFLAALFHDARKSFPQELAYPGSKLLFLRMVGLAISIPPFRVQFD